MATYMKRAGSLDGSPAILHDWPVNASQTVVAGSIVVLNTSKLDVAADAASAGTVAGVAQDALTTGTSVDADDTVRVDVNPNSIYWMYYTGSSKTSLTDEDIGKKFDLDDAYTIDLDDTTGGFCMYVGGDDTVNDMCKVQILGMVQNV